MQNINSMDFDNFKINQPTINIGMIGSVSNGKSTITEKITGIKTQKYSKELERNITIKLGYANAKIYKCPECQPPICYQPFHSEIFEARCKHCDKELVLQKHISILDVPGHNLLMATMLNGTCVMDTSILIEAANNEIPAPQTREHLVAGEIIGLKNNIVCLNKVDLVKKEKAITQIKVLENYLQNTIAKNNPIVPISGNYGINIDVLCEYICTKIPEPNKDLKKPLKMIIIRSFNINHPNVTIDELQGGVVGGTIIDGRLKIGDKIKILPGLIKSCENQQTKWTFKPILSIVESINSEKNELKEAIPGGLIGVKLSIDPALTCKDRLIGNIMMRPDEDNNYLILETLYVMLELLADRNIKLEKNSIIIVNSNANNTKGKITKIKKQQAIIELLEKPLCIKENDYVTLSRYLENSNIQIIGRAQIVGGISSLGL